MNLEQLMKMLIRHEGRMIRIYTDHLGYLTGGVGHLITAKDGKWTKGDIISGERIDKWFEADIRIAIGIAQAYTGKVVWDRLSSERQIVLVNMAFNMGYKLNQFIKLKAALTVQRYDLAANAMRDSTWAKQVPNRANELITIMSTGVI